MKKFKFLFIGLAMVLVFGCSSMQPATVQDSVHEVQVTVTTDGSGETNVEEVDEQREAIDYLNGENRGILSQISFVTDEKLYLYLYSGLSVADVVRFDKDLIKVENGTDIRDARVFLNSPGGDAFTGLALADTIVNAKARGWNVTVEANGIIASAAVPVFAVCSKRIASPGSIFMVHEAALWKWPGRETASDIDAQQSLFKLLRSRYLQYLVDNSNLSSEQWRSMEKVTTWFSAEKALEYGLVDLIR